MKFRGMALAAAFAFVVLALWSVSRTLTGGEADPNAACDAEAKVVHADLEDLAAPLDPFVQSPAVREHECSGTDALPALSLLITATDDPVAALNLLGEHWVVDAATQSARTRDGLYTADAHLYTTLETETGATAQSMKITLAPV